MASFANGFIFDTSVPAASLYVSRDTTSTREPNFPEPMLKKFRQYLLIYHLLIKTLV